MAGAPQRLPFDAVAMLSAPGVLSSLECDFRASAGSTASSSETLSQGDEEPQLRKSCDYCVKMKRGCDGGTPCDLCRRRKKQCIRSVKKRSGPAKGTKYSKRRPRKPAGTTSPESVTRPDASTAKTRTSTAFAAPKRATHGSTLLGKSKRKPKHRTQHPSPAQFDASLATDEDEARPVSPHLHTAGTAMQMSSPASRPSTMCGGDSHERIRNVTSKGGEQSVAFAAAAAVEASQARWKERGLDHTDRRTDCMSMLALNFAPEKVDDHATPSALIASFDDLRSGARSAMEEVSVPPAAPCHGASSRSLCSEVGRHEAVCPYDFRQDSLANHHAVRAIGSRRSSVEQLPHGPLDKRSSFTSRPECRDFDIDANNAMGLFWNTRLLADGPTQDSTRPLIEPAVCGSGEQSDFSSWTTSPLSMLRTTGALSLGQHTQDDMRAAPTSMVAPGVNACDGGGVAQSSLRDLLLEKWPPVAFNEVSLAEFAL